MYTHVDKTIFLFFMNLTDIDECLRNPCHTNATCNNTAGSYICVCVILILSVLALTVQVAMYIDI